MRRARLALLAVSILVLAAATYAAAMLGRIDRFAVTLPPDQPGDTWLVLGSDGRNADVVLVVHRDGGTVSTFSVPTDVVASPQAVVDAVCTTLGFAADHVVVVGFSGFTRVVDAVGGVDVETRNPLRDIASGLDVPTPGRAHLDGAETLAWVRSRQPERLVDGRWVPLRDGDARRLVQVGYVFAKLQGAVDDIGLNPFRLHRAVWAGSGAVAVDDGTSVRDLLRFAGDSGALQPLPPDVTAACDT